jgi:hypothetical protein
MPQVDPKSIKEQEEENKVTWLQVLTFFAVVYCAIVVIMHL